MFEYYFSLVTDEGRVINRENLENTSALQGTERKAEKKIVKGKFLNDLKCLQENGYALTPGSKIEITLQDILQIVPRDRKRVDAYNSLVKYLNDEFYCSLYITSQKTKKEDNV